MATALSPPPAPAPVERVPPEIRAKLLRLLVLKEQLQHRAVSPTAISISPSASSIAIAIVAGAAHPANSPSFSATTSSCAAAATALAPSATGLAPAPSPPGPLESPEGTPRSAPPGPLESPEGTPRSAQTCTICFSGPRDAVLLECGHGGFCCTCALTALRKRPDCPICRQRVSQVVQLRLEPAAQEPGGEGPGGAPPGRLVAVARATPQAPPYIV